MKSLPLSQTHPELALEADGWDPSQVSAGTNKKAKWKCALGHQFESPISLRAGKGTGCPSCKNRRVEPGFNDLKTKFPDIAKEANGWDPSEVLFGSHAKKLWKCPQDHSYEAQVDSRTGKGKSGCPYCVNQKVLTGYNDLATTHPEIAKEADGWDPKEVITGSNKRKTWKCQSGHSFTAAVSDRIGSGKENRKGTGCPVCINQKILIGYNDLATTHPDLAAEADGWDPKEVVAGTSKKQNWKCPIGHRYKTVISLRALRGTGCPVCSNLQVLAGFNDLLTTHPEIAKEADGWDPTTVIAGTSKKYRWKCQEGHLYLSPPDARTGKRKQGCAVCANQKVLAGFNDLATTHPEIAKEADGWDPTTVVAGSKESRPWKCAKGHMAVQPILYRSRADISCPTCGNREVLAGFNDLATTHPEIAKEADGWDPTFFLASNEAKQKWKCSKGHNYYAVIYSRALAGNGCSVCGNRTVLAGYNDLATTHPEIAAEAEGWDASTVTYGNETKQKWKCPKGHSYLISPNGRTSAGKENRGCPVCANQQLLSGYNDLATRYPLIAAEADGWDPTKVIAGSRRKQKWKCPEGHTYFASQDSRTSKGSGCPSCAEFGYDPNKDGYLYFLEHPVWEMFQIGITNFPDDRLGNHRKLGWEVLELRGPMDGHLTQNWETSILRMLKKRGADLSNSKIAGKFDGYSEAWSKTTFHATSIKELMRVTEEYEEGL